MKVVHTVADLQKELLAFKKENKSIGFVPTMGALHNGHIALVKKCIAENDICVVSIFVNPTQFNDKKDLIQYPRNLEADCKLLESAGTTMVFAPQVEEMYPEPDTRKFDFGTLETVMEGCFRPGHFNGVAQVVSKLFYMVEPDCAYFGEKDFQQLAIIRKMVDMLKLNVKIIPCPIVRENDGLAMSSRNTRLTPSQRKVSAKISAVLLESLELAKKMSVKELKDRVIQSLNSYPELRTEYFEIVDGNNLNSITQWVDTNYPVGCVAVFCGEVRLIDNIKYNI